MKFIVVTFEMIVRIQVLRNGVVGYNWAIFIVDETKQLKDIFVSIKSGTHYIYELYFYGLFH